MVKTPKTIKTTAEKISIHFPLDLNSSNTPFAIGEISTKKSKKVAVTAPNPKVKPKLMLEIKELLLALRPTRVRTGVQRLKEIPTPKIKYPVFDVGLFPVEQQLLFLYVLKSRVDPKTMVAPPIKNFPRSSLRRV